MSNQMKGNSRIKQRTFGRTQKSSSAYASVKLICLAFCLSNCCHFNLHLNPCVGIVKFLSRQVEEPNVSITAGPFPMGRIRALSRSSYRPFLVFMQNVCIELKARLWALDFRDVGETLRSSNKTKTPP